MRSGALRLKRVGKTMKRSVNSTLAHLQSWDDPQWCVIPVGVVKCKSTANPDQQVAALHPCPHPHLPIPPSPPRASLLRHLPGISHVVPLENRLETAPSASPSSHLHGRDDPRPRRPQHDSQETEGSDQIGLERPGEGQSSSVLA